MNCQVRIEELSALLASDQDEASARALRQHAEQCPVCQQALARLSSLDQQVRSSSEEPVPLAAVRRARRVVQVALRPEQVPEIMTIDEVGAYLRLSPEQLAEMIEELPSFAVAGEFRIRRDRLMEWVAQREQQNLQERLRSQAAKSIRQAFERGIAS